MFVSVLNPHGTVHRLETHDGEWHGWNNIAMGFDRDEGRQVVETILQELNSGATALSYDFQIIKVENETA